MLFNSFEFLIFFPIVFVLYFAVPSKYRWILLLISSYYFYMSWKLEYIFLIIFSTVVDYYAGIQIGESNTLKRKRIFLFLSLATNLGVLFSFKYFNFFNESLRMAFDQLNIFYDVPAFNLLLPVGISFYTFQTMSYSIDVYRGAKEPERHLGLFALYVAFFPQLVAGPIERSVRLLPQFHQTHQFDYQRVTSGFQLMAWGFFKKIVIADRVAVLVNVVYNNPSEYTGLTLIVATYLFAYQIYCDFSGYSDIAIGAAQVLGYDLMLNFKQPYFSKSIGEFWQRWHISLSTWFRDYLYIPLGGNRVSTVRWYVNIMIVFVVSGLWHGANWTFVIWGGLHGFYYLLEGIFIDPVEKFIFRKANSQWSKNLRQGIRIFLNFQLVCFAWVFFRANTLADATYIGRHLFVDWSSSVSQLSVLITGRFGEIQFLYAIGAILVLEVVHVFQTRIRIRQYVATLPLVIRWVAYFALILSILGLGKFGTGSEFIYFQF